MSNITASLPIAIVVGAGPAGLTLSHLFQRYHQTFTLIDSKSGLDDLSKATGLHRSTLQLLSKIGVIDEIAKQSIVLNANRMYENQKLVKRVVFTQGELPHDKNISMTQQGLEEILLATLKGQAVDFNEELLAFTQDEDGVTGTIRNVQTGEESILKAKYLIACDGAKSSIRKMLNLTFEGETTAEQAFTFDALILDDSNHHEMAMHTTETERLVIVPIPGERNYKFSGRISDVWHKTYALSEGTGLSIELAQLVFKRSGLHIDPQTIRGLSFYHTASRLTSSMREGRVFLIGDAAHVFFPAGGYGLNTAIEDAFCLAWRLVMMECGAIHPNQLQSFSGERLANAKLIQQDSNQKKAESLNAKSQTEGSVVELERQIYVSSQRLDTLLDFFRN